MSLPIRGLAAVLAAALTAACLAVTAPATASATSGDPASAKPTTPPAVSLAAAQAAVNGQRLSGRAGRDATAALTSLRLSYADLAGEARLRADALLARPTDGAADPNGFGYSVPEATPLCGPDICVHYVATTADAPAPVDADADAVPDWVQTTLTTMEQVWDLEVDTLGYRSPVSDGDRGGSPAFDVYLADIGSDGLYGFCAPERKAPRQKYVYSGYCVLDQDFTEFAIDPTESLRVTAAHEFFHAIQFAYDATEDRWLMEATATWIEGLFAGEVDDNRQFLRYGQLRQTKTPLDEFDTFGRSQYGNWLFFQALSDRFGVDSVRNIWERVDGTKGARDDYSIHAVSAFLSSRKTNFASFYARFAAFNQDPAQFYAEGGSYRPAPVVRSMRLTSSRRSVSAGGKLDHLTSAAYRVRPAKSLGAEARLRLTVAGPATGGAHGAAAALLVHDRAGGTSVREVRLNASGRGRTTLRLKNPGSNKPALRDVTVVMANGSTRFTCFRGTRFSCQGAAKDDRQPFSFTASAIP